MPQTPKTRSAAVADPADAPAHWEERAVGRVLQTSREQILERSHRIVDAAYELLGDGLEGLTIRAVLDATGLSRRAFYERFEGKDDLVLAVFEQTLRRACRHFGDTVKTLPDPMARLQFIVTSIALRQETLQDPDSVEGNRRGAAMSREHLRLAESRPQELQAALSPLIALIAEQLEAGMAAGVVREGDPRRMATLLYNLVSTTVLTELLAEETAPDDPQRRAQLASDLWEFCRRGVAA